MKRAALFILLLVLQLNACLYGQNKAIDSLSKLTKSTSDTSLVLVFHELGRQYNAIEQTNKARENISKALTLSTKLNYTRGKFTCYNIFARSCQIENDYPKAIEFYLKALKLAELSNNKIDIAITYQRIALMHTKKGNFNESLEPLTKALSIYQQLKDLKNVAAVHIQIALSYGQQKKNTLAVKELGSAVDASKRAKDTFSLGIIYEQLGNLYTNIGDFENSLHFHKASLEMSKHLKDWKGVADSYSDIGNIYLAQKKYTKALESNQSALELYKQYAEEAAIAESHMILGQVYMYMKQPLKAIDSHLAALKITEQLDDKGALSATVYLSLGDVYLSSEEFNKAGEAIYKVVAIAKALNNEWMLKKCYQKLSDVALKKTDYKSAYEFQKLFAQTSDSVYTSNNMEDKKIQQLQKQFEEEKKINEKRLHVAELSQKESELKQASTVRFALIAGLVLIVGFAGFIYNRFKLTQRQKETISKQKEETESQKLVIEHKQKEIIESISYAKRLQEAILPPQEFVNKYVPDNFILYKPKDLVAGDFYWAEQVNDKFFIAAADSTGHGVPGAMVSVVCSNALNRAVKEFKETETGKILDKTRELVVETFEKSDNDVKDGMDISLLCIDKDNQKIYWSGANNPLWYIEAGTLKEIKANKQPIGKTDSPKPFTSHIIPYVPGNVFYLFTDGFADQFGGPKGKKFKYKQLEETFARIYNEPLNKQSEQLQKTFENWKGDLEQVDDVCIIGIRV